MLRKLTEFIVGGILILIFLAMIRLLMSTLPQAASPTLTLSSPTQVITATGDFAEQLRSRLESEGVPVKDVRIVQENPFEVEINLQSSSSTDKLSFDDDWYRALAEHEANLAYFNLGKRINIYSLNILNTEGIVLYRGWSELNIERPSQQLQPAPPARIDDQETKDQLMNLWNKDPMTVLSLNVETGHYVRPNTKYVEVVWSTGDLASDEATYRANGIFGGMNNFIKDQFNPRTGAQISIVRARIQDSAGNVVGDYILDLDLQSMASWPADWMPSPAIQPGETPLPGPTEIPTPTNSPATPTLAPTSPAYP